MSEQRGWPLWAKVAVAVFIVFVVLPVIAFFVQSAIGPGTAHAQVPIEDCPKCVPPRDPVPLPGVEPPKCEPGEIQVWQEGEVVYSWDGCGGIGFYVPLQCPAGYAEDQASYTCQPIRSVFKSRQVLYNRPTPEGGYERGACDNYGITVGPVEMIDVSLCQKWSWKGNEIVAHDKMAIRCDPGPAGDLAQWNCLSVTARASQWRDGHRGWWESATREYEHCLTVLLLTIRCDTYRMVGKMTVWAGGGYGSNFDEEV